MTNSKEIKYRVRRSVNPTNHVKRGIRQVLFPYDSLTQSTNLNLSVLCCFHTKSHKNAPFPYYLTRFNTILEVFGDFKK